MARPNTQRERRADLIEACRTAIVERGIVGLRLRDVADRAGMSSSSVFYYYSALNDLLQDVLTEAVDRFCIDRSVAVAHIADPRHRLLAMIRTGLPASVDDELCRLLYDLGSLARREAAQAARYVGLYERQAAMYVGILEAGAAHGHFKFASDTLTIARNLVVLEDGFGLHVTMAVPTFDIATSERLIVSYASIATNCDLAALNYDPALDLKAAELKPMEPGR